jgi:hypothetical protein
LLGGVADGRRDLGGVAVQGFLEEGSREASSVELAEEAVDAEQPVGVEDLLGDLVAGSDVDGLAAAGAGVEGRPVDQEAPAAWILGRRYSW